MAKEPSAVQDLIAAQGACDPVVKDATCLLYTSPSPRD